MAGEPAYEAATLLLERSRELAAARDLREAVQRRLAAFAEGAGADLERVRGWALVRLVREAVWCRDHQPEAVAQVDAVVAALL